MARKSSSRRKTSNNTMAKVRSKDIKKRKGPPWSATSFNLGTRKKGNDGKMWTVKRSGKTKRWVRGAEEITLAEPIKTGAGLAVGAILGSVAVSAALVVIAAIVGVGKSN